MAKAYFDTMPPELLPNIFSYACTDEGQTGCILGLVSKAFRDICLDSGVDIQSASICGRRKIELFLNMLQRRERQKRRVVSLFLSWREGDGGEDDGCRLIIPGPNDEGIEAAEGTKEAMLAVLRTVSPDHLRILHAEFPGPRTGASRIPVAPVPLPSLQELSISGSFELRSLTASHILPALEKLYIGAFMVAEEDFGSALSVVCPRLTHLRIRVASKHQPLDDNLLHFVHAYCNLSRPLEAMGPWDDLNNVDAEEGQSDGDDVLNVHDETTSSLRRVIIEFPTVLLLSRSGRVPEGTTHITRQVRAYRDVASRAKRTRRIDEDGEKGTKSLVLLPPPPLVRVERRREHVVGRFLKAKEEWLALSVGRGRSYWS